MEWLIASAIGVMTASGVWLLLRSRSFTVILGLIMLSYATNLMLFSMGRLKTAQPAVIADQAVEYTDPLPQALVLTAIVISFGMTAVIVVLALRTFLETHSDEVRLESGRGDRT